MMVVQTIAGLLFAAGLAYLLLALRATGRGLPRRSLSAWRPPVSVMIPAHGVRPRLEECLRSVCRLDYPGLQVVFGLHSPDDEARPAIERIMREFPALDTVLVVDGRRIGSNPKNANLANMLASCRHDVLVMVDCDVLVPPDFLDRLVPALADGGVGAVSCLYSGLPEAGLPSRLGALYHNDWFIPSVLVDFSRGDEEASYGCYGAAIGVTRRTLAAIGGFEAMADAVAQDYVLGHRMRLHGYRVVLADTMVATVVSEPSLAALIRHELRWNRAFRSVRPVEHALSAVMSPLPALLVLLAAWPLPWAALALAVHLGLRQLLHRQLRRRFGLPAAEPWLVPVREAINLLVWAMALAGRNVRWDDRVMTTGKGLSMHPAPERRISTR